MATQKPSSIMALISPPDEPLHSFSQPSSPIATIAQPKIEDKRTSSFSRHLPSPQSPAVSTFDLATKFRNWPAEFSNARTVATNLDPILYPERRSSAEYNPLFEDDNQTPAKLQPPPPFLTNHKFSATIPKDPSVVSSPESTATTSAGESVKHNEEQQFKEALIDDHYRNRVLLPQYIQSKSKVTKWSTPKKLVLPTREQYNLILDIAWQSKVMKDYNSSPSSYLKRQREENDENYYSGKRQRSVIGHTTILKPKDDGSMTITLQTPRARKPAKKPVDRSGTPEVKHRRTAVKKTKAIFSYDEIPDYAPSVDTIPTDKNFRVTWNGQPLDLSNDPDRGLLHPAEIQLASKLRFPCDQYLKTKRRVFVGRVNNLIKHPNKQFCKTDAQQVGGVDVNKLSQLWEAYNSIGWFNASHFKGHVVKVRDATLVYDPKNTKWVEHKELFGF